MIDSEPGGFASGGGECDAARGVLDDIEKLSRQRYFPPYHRALIHAGLGERDEAFRRLEAAHEERYPWLVLLRVEPRLDSLRADPRFADLVRRVALESDEHSERFRLRLVNRS